MKKWKALILGGGGSTGEFQIGALPVICSHYDSFDMFIGVGVGSLHASVLAQYESLNEGANVLIKLWRNIEKTSDILESPFLGADIGTLLALASDKAWARDGAFKNNKLKKIIDQYINWEDLKQKNNWAIRLTSLSDGRLYTVSNIEKILNESNNDGHRTSFTTDPNSPFYFGDKLTDVVTAAGSVPLMLSPVDINGHRFVEGGLRDFTPLDLAIQAFEAHPDKDSFDEAEFIIIDNYRREVEFETPDLLDSGNEIILRAIKIMTVEMAQNDITTGELKLENLSLDTKLIKIQPQTDFRMHPMNFDDLEKRAKQRRHGAEQAFLAMSSNQISTEEAITRINNELIQGNRTEEHFEKLLELSKLNTKKVSAILDPNIVLKPNNDFAGRYHKMEADKILFPTSLSELKAILKTHAKKDIPLKAMGSGYAFSNILNTDGKQVKMDKLKTIFSPARSLLNPGVDANQLLEFEAGATIQDLNHKLWPIGRTLLNQPGYEHLNYFGVCTTGGHGSGLNLGPIANAIRSMHLISLDSNNKIKEYKIEPSNGITNPVAYRQRFPNIELIQDDDIFNSTIVSVGAFGVVYSLVIETQNRFFLKENRFMTDWESIKDTIFDKLDSPDIHSVHIWLNPYKVKGKTACVLSEYTRDPGPPKGIRPWGTSWYVVDELSPIIEFITRTWPKEIPKILKSSLKQTVNRKPVIMPNTQALNFGSPNHAVVHATNCSFPADRSLDFVDAMQTLFADKFDNDIYVTSPVGLRYTSPGKGYISPQYDQRSCMIELPILQGTDDAISTIKDFHKMVFDQFGGRPHWGQINPIVNKERFKSMFPEWKKFVKTFDKFNKGHFDNAFTKQVGLRDLINEI